MLALPGNELQSLEYINIYELALPACRASRNGGDSNSQHTPIKCTVLSDCLVCFSCINPSITRTSTFEPREGDTFDSFV